MSAPAQAVSRSNTGGKGVPGFTQIPNYWFDKCLKLQTAAEIKFQLLTWRETIGRTDENQPGGRIKEARISDKYWIDKTGNSPKQKQRAVRGLLAKEMLKVTRHGRESYFSPVDVQTLRDSLPQRMASGDFPPVRTAGRGPNRTKSQPAIAPFCLENGCERSGNRKAVGDEAESHRTVKAITTVAPPSQKQESLRGSGADNGSIPRQPPQQVATRVSETIRKSFIERRTPVSYVTTQPIDSKGYYSEKARSRLKQFDNPAPEIAARLKEIEEIGTSTLGTAMGGRAWPKGLEGEVLIALPTASLNHLRALCNAKCKSGYPITDYRLILKLCADAEEPGAKEVFEKGQSAEATIQKKNGFQEIVETERKRRQQR